MGAEDDTDADSTSSIPSAFTRLRHFISPRGIKWTRRGSQLGELHTRTYVVSGWPKEVQAHFLYHLYSDSSLYFNCSLHYEPYEQAEAVETLDDIETQLADKTHGELAQYIPNVESLEETRHIVKETKRSIENDGETLFDISMSVTAFAGNKENLDAFEARIREILETESNMELMVPESYPDLAHISSSPLGKPALKDKYEVTSQMALGETVGATFPFIEETFTEPEGIVYGMNTANGTGIIVDIFNRNNGYNKLVIGDIGSGKSFSTGAYLLRHYVMYPEDNIVIIDPMGGFVGVTYALDGERIIVNGSETINPLQIEAQSNPDAIDGDPYKTKLDDVRWFFTRFFNQYSTEGLTAAERAPLDRAIQTAYQRKGITKDPSTHSNESPTIADVMDVLQDIADNPEQYTASGSVKEISKWEESAASLLMAMEPFREGNELDNLVGPTDFEISPDIPTYIDMSQLDGKQDLGLMMKIVFSMIYEQVKEYEGRSIICMDEAHKIIDDPEEADHWEELFRHSRHHDLSIWLLSQEFEDFFKSEDGEGANEAAKTMASLCMVQQIHRVSNVNRKLAKDALDLTDDHIDYIESAIPGESDEDYTTALLNVNDIGYFGLKVTATKNELALIDYDPSEEWGDGENENTIPESSQIKRGVDLKNKLTGTRTQELEGQEQVTELPPENDDEATPAIEAATDGSGTQLPDVADDPLIQEIIDDTPIENFDEKLKTRIADRLIEDSSTPYQQSHRDLILSALTTDEGLEKLHKPELIGTPQEDGTVNITINPNELSQSDTETYVNDDPRATPPDDSLEAEDDTDESHSDETSPWVFSESKDELAAQGGSDPSGRPEIDWHDRVDEHKNAIERLGHDEIMNMADILSLDNAPLETTIQQIAEEHARREVSGVGKTAPLGAIKEITRTLTWGVEEALNKSLEQNAKETTGEETKSKETPPEESRGSDTNADDSNGDNVHENPVPYNARKRAHADALEDLPAEELTTIRAALNLEPGLNADKEKTISAIASAHSQREISDSGLQARVQPSTQIDRSKALATAMDQQSSSQSPSGPAPTPTIAPTDDRNFETLPEDASSPTFTTRKSEHKATIGELTPRHRTLIANELTYVGAATDLSQKHLIDQIATAHAVIEIEAGTPADTHRISPSRRIKESTPRPPIPFPARKQRYTDVLSEYPKETLTELYTDTFNTTPPGTTSRDSIASEIAIQIARKEIQTATATAPIAIEDHFPQLETDE